MRQVGTTTAQMLAAAPNSFYVWCNENKSYAMCDDYDYVADYQEWKRQRDQLRRLYIICGIIAACNIALLAVLWH